MAGVSGAQDYEAAGLLEGLGGEALAQRIELLDQLSADGFALEELVQAASDGRLTLLPVERALAGEPAYSQREISELSGVPVETLDRQRRALGLIVGDPDERTLSADDLQAAKRVRVFLDAGVDPEAIVETARVMAMSMSQLVAANRELLGPLLAADGADELELAQRFKGLAATLTPQIGPTLEYIYKHQLHDQFRDLVLGADLAEGDEAVDEMAVAFADLVGYTRLGERLPPEELGRLTGRLAELATDAAGGSVRLIKLIGDAAMFASPDVEALVSSSLDLSAAAAEQGEGFPAVRVGIATGPVLSRGGDLYGGTVNLASRITDVAYPGSVLVSAPVRDAVGDAFAFSDAGPKRLKGIKRPVHVFRCRRHGERERDAAAQRGVSE